MQGNFLLYNILGSNVDVVADLHQIPLADNSLDGVTSVAVLEHIKEPTIVVKETLRFDLNSRFNI